MEDEGVKRGIHWEYLVGGAVALVIVAVLFWPQGAGSRTDAEAAALAGAFVARGDELLAADRKDEAMVEFGKAVGLDPRNQSAHYKLGLLFVGKQLFEAAEASFGAALAVNEDALTHLAMGLMALERQLIEPAVFHFRRTTELDPSISVGHLDLGVALLRSGQTKPSIDAFRAALAVEPGNQSARHNLGFALRLAGEYELSIVELERVVAADPEASISHYELGVSYALAGRRSAARVSFERVLVLEPRHDQATLQLAKLPL